MATATFLFYLLFWFTTILANVTTAITIAANTIEPNCVNIRLYAVKNEPLLPYIP